LNKRGKVFCITLNTAIDHVIQINALNVGTTIRAENAQLVAAGKGVDVAVGVAELGGKAIATGFIGESSRQIFAKLADENVELMFIEVPGATRINVTILERELSRETHLQTVGYTISRGDLQRLSGLLECAIKPDDVVVFGGSLPPGSSEGVAEDLVMLCKKLGAYVILDASGPALLDGLRAQPHMVKPNLLELSQILGRSVQNSDNAVAQAAQECLTNELDRVVVSRGSLGIIVAEKGQVWKAWTNSTQDHSTAGVGSGDALVAAFAFSRLLSRPLESAMRLGVACGAANLHTKLPGRFSAAEAAKLALNAEVLRLD
jgi:1-phosphofructokinase